MVVLTTQQILSFIQYKIVVTHAAGGDVRALLTNPEVAFSLQVLESNYRHLMPAPAVSDINYESVQQLATADTNTNDGLGQTQISLF